jgi:HK97 family phage portal protein
MASTRKKGTLQIEKAQVALPAPGVQTRFSLLGKSNSANNIIDYSRRSNGSMYYEMYRQHPVVRAAIDRKSTYASAGGWNYVSPEPGSVPKDTKVKFLKSFSRRSNIKQLLRLTYKDLDIYGESFWAVISGSDASRTPIKVLRLNPRFMQARLSDAGIVVGWTYGPISTDSTAIEYGVDEVLHFKLEDPEDDTRGLSPLHSLQRAVAQDIFAMEYNESFFKNSAQTGIVFIVKSSSKEEADRNRAWIEQNYSGPENAHRPLLIEGDVDVKSSVAKPAEMEFLEGRKLLRQEILMVLEMDPDKVGVHDTSNRSTSKEAAYAFLSEVIWPRQNIIEDEFNNAFILGRLGWEDIVVDSAEGDPRRNIDMAEIFDKHVNSGRMSINEARRKMGEAPTVGGDVPFVMTPTGIIFVANLPELQKQALDQIKNPPPPAVPAVTTGLGTGKQPNQPNQKPGKQPLTRDNADAVKQGDPNNG